MFLRRTVALATTLALATCAIPAAAQQKSPIYRDRNGNYQGAEGVFQVSDDGTDIREAYKLVAANTPSAAVTLYGGDYILSQACTAYGTLTLQVLGPDGTTYQTLVSKTASDGTSGTGLGIGAHAVVRIQVSGTTGCNAVLARVPA